MRQYSRCTLLSIEVHSNCHFSALTYTYLLNFKLSMAPTGNPWPSFGFGQNVFLYPKRSTLPWLNQRSSASETIRHCTALSYLPILLPFYLSTTLAQKCTNFFKLVQMSIFLHACGETQGQMSSCHQIQAVISSALKTFSGSWLCYIKGDF